MPTSRDGETVGPRKSGFASFRDMKSYGPSCSAVPCHGHCTRLAQKSGSRGRRAERSSVTGVGTRGVSWGRCSGGRRPCLR